MRLVLPTRTARPTQKLLRAARSRHDHSAMSDPTLRQRPGLAKARLSLVSLRSGPTVRAEDPAWRALFASADAVSEGSVRREGSAAVWYGSTSLILPLPATYGPTAREFVAAVAA